MKASIVASMIKVNPIIIAILIMFNFECFAHTSEEGQIWVTTGPYFYQTKTSASQPEKAPYVGYGLIAEGDVDFNGGVEIALFYLDKLYFLDRGGDQVVEKIKRMFITTGYRHWFKKTFSFAGALFSSYSMGDAKIVVAPDKAGELRTSARDITEYGMDFSLQTEIWGNEQMAAVIVTRYSWSTTRNQGEDADVYGVALAFKYLIPKKHRD
jgi:hypothetical protein